MTFKRMAAALAATLALAGCAVPHYAPTPKEAAAPPAAQREAMTVAALNPAAKKFKRKIAIGRFSNETRYGRAFLADDSNDPLGKQVSDMLSARLVESGAFLVFERPDLDKLKKEQQILGSADLIGVDTLILGSLTEFGRSTNSRGGLFSSTKLQKVHAKVEIRLADPRTGRVFFSAAGQGNASSEAGEVLGYGSAADYDASLNDKAIGAAVSDLMNALVTKLDERPWRTEILKVEAGRVFISGGARQGLRVGDTLAVMKAGEQIRSGQTGMMVSLPPTEVARIRVAALFGDDDTNEGAVCEPASGSLAGVKTADLFVTEAKGN